VGWTAKVLAVVVLEETTVVEVDAMEVVLEVGLLVDEVLDAVLEVVLDTVLEAELEVELVLLVDEAEVVLLLLEAVGRK
jgi:hypothetical protein